MDFLRRHRFVLAFGLLLGFILLGWWATRPGDVTNTPAHVETVASAEEPPAKAPPPATASSVSDVGPPANDTASSFGTFRGRVIDAVTREPVREFEVEFHGMRSTKAGQEIPGAQTFRADDGRFEWQYALPGNWTVTVSAPGYQRFVLNKLQIASGVTTPEVVLPLRSGQRLQGRVYDEATRAGIAAANISFRESDVGRFDGKWRIRPNTTTAKNGSFVLEGVPAGRITLMVDAPDHASREVDVVVGEKTSPVEIGLVTGGAITGYLAAADGRTPVAGWAGLFNLDQGFGGSSPTGEAGEFSFQHLPAGRYQLTAHAAAGGTAEREIVLGSNERIEGIVLALTAGRSIRGVVTGLRPEDLERLRVSVQRDGDYLGSPAAEVRVDERGAYTVPGVPPGRVHVVADNSRRQLSKAVDMPADADLTVNLDFPRGARLSGRVTRGGKPVASAWLEPRAVVEQPGTHVYGASTSKTGEYVFDDLAPGEYNVWVGTYRSRTVQLSGDTVFDIEVPPAHLSGRVLEEGGKVPVVGAAVEIWPAQPGSPRIRLSDDSDHFGQFALAGLEPGDFMLTAYKPGYEMYRERFSYGSPTAGMTIRLRRGKGVEISVHEAGSGESLQKVHVLEKIGDRNGSQMQLHLDENGVGYIPSALAGSTLVFSAFGYAHAEIRAWSGQGLELQLHRQEVR